jgi:hypothetical protein
MKGLESIERRIKKFRTNYETVKKRETNIPLLATAAIVFILAMLRYKNMVIVETGLIITIFGLIQEWRGTSTGMWSYGKSLYKIRGKIPVEVIPQYFFIGSVVAIYYLFRTVGI